MAVKIRLKRMGRKNRAFYRICVFDGRTRRDGTPIEELGSYDPEGVNFAAKVKLDRERAHYWLTVGAQPSETVASILRRSGVRKDKAPEPLPEAAPEPVAAVAADAAPEPAPAAHPIEVAAEPAEKPAGDEA